MRSISWDRMDQREGGPTELPYFSPPGNDLNVQLRYILPMSYGKREQN